MKNLLKKFLPGLLLGAVTLTVQAVQAAPELIAFVRSASGSAGDIYTIQPDGRNMKRLTYSGTSTAPAWVPGGKQLVYVSKGQLRIMNANGTNSKALTRLKGWTCDSPNVSRDGKKIVFQAERAYTYKYEGGEALAVEEALWTINITGANTRKLAVKPTNTLSTPLWSRDGQNLIYQVDGNELEWGDAALRQVSLRGGKPTVLYGWGKTKAFYDIRDPALSSDGRRVAAFSFGLSTGNGVQEQPGLIVLNVNGTGLRHVLRFDDSGQLSGPDWSRDGKNLVFVTADTLEILELENGNRRRVVFRGQGSSSPAWQR